MVETSIVPEEVETSASSPAIGGTRTAPRRCCTSSTRSGSNMCATRSTSIGRPTSAAALRSTGKTALDVGCGAGLLAEPLARLGATVDRARCRARTDRGGARACRGDGPRDRLSRRRTCGARRLLRPHHLHGGGRACHRPCRLHRRLAERLAPDGLLILSTPNATGWSKLLTVTLAEGLGRIPKGTHDFDKFIGPDRMKTLLNEARLTCLDVEGIAFSPTRGLHLSDDLRLNYLVSAVGRD